ncbi:RagB/SusD family nutrient uptake outer membrane protein [Cesiribacter sp. SM1]|uniref:RagB/SusD family nutrient uptake outer membrane protein n=1 Tax=Cesiribacter sp. SM1 TaxID=2861196 RepID=UPI001CD76E7E|nr:RagB/SusD family nutrient uptake outer membrane protein [Cesiribacter sp. SM1]
MSCEDFVDEPQPQAEVGSEAVFSSPEGVRAFLTGTYRALRGFNDELANTTASNDDSEGYGSLMNTRTVVGNDFVQPAFQWMAFEYRYLARESSNSRKVNFVWNMAYEIINSMNLLIEGVEASGLSENQKEEFIAEARAIRGLMYFEAVKEYALPYAAGRDNVGIPIYLESASVASTGNPRKSVGEVYDVIRADLEYASANIPVERDFKWRINKAVADGILARVYLHMGLWSEAATAANSARTTYGAGLAPASYADGFDVLESPEWIWGLPFSADQTLYYGSFASFWDGTRYTPTIKANPTFVAEFSETDVRNLFTPIANDVLYDVEKFEANPDFGEDVVLMRVAEMYLIEAEGLARSGSEDAAAELLFELQSNRDPMFTTPSGNTGDALIEEILLERRKELYAEGLADFPDYRRLQMGWSRDASHPAAFRFALEPNDYRFFLLIPQAEIDANPAINEEDQNPNAPGDTWPAAK